MILALLLALSPISVYANNLTVAINGQPIAFADQGPALVDGRTLVPVAGVFQALGFETAWDGDARQVTITRGGDIIVITIDSNAFTTNGITHALDVPAQIIGGRTMLPVSAVLISAGYDVGWDGPTSTVLISSAAPPSSVSVALAPPSEPAASFVSHQQVFDYFTDKLREATPTLLEDFRAVGTSIADADVLTEMRTEKVALLSEVMETGLVEMADLWNVHGIGDEAIYLSYSERLSAVHREEMEWVDHLWRELLANRGRAPVQTFNVGDTIAMDNATIRITNVTTQASYQGWSPIDGYIFCAITFDITVYNPRLDGARWSAGDFIGPFTGASGIVYRESSIFDVSGFVPLNQQSTFMIFVTIPVDETITSINVSDDGDFAVSDNVEGMAIVSIR